jgi:hypothetical protein
MLKWNATKYVLEEEYSEGRKNMQESVSDYD